MLYDIDFADEMKAIFYRAVMVDGIIDVPRCLAFGASRDHPVPLPLL